MPCAVMSTRTCKLSMAELLPRQVKKAGRRARAEAAAGLGWPLCFGSSEALRQRVLGRACMVRHEREFAMLVSAAAQAGRCYRYLTRATVPGPYRNAIHMHVKVCTSLPVPMCSACYH